MSESDAIGQGETVRNVRCVLDTGRTDTSDSRTDRPSDLLLATFGGKGSGIWFQTTRGERCVPADFPKPDWLDDPSHTLAEMGPPSWNAVDQPGRVHVARRLKELEPESIRRGEPTSNGGRPMTTWFPVQA
jgi:hypothetical protein